MCFCGAAAWGFPGFEAPSGTLIKIRSHTPSYSELPSKEPVFHIRGISVRGSVIVVRRASRFGGFFEDIGLRIGV